MANLLLQHGANAQAVTDVSIYFSKGLIVLFMQKLFSHVHLTISLFEILLIVKYVSLLC